VSLEQWLERTDLARSHSFLQYGLEFTPNRPLSFTREIPGGTESERTGVSARQPAQLLDLPGPDQRDDVDGSSRRNPGKPLRIKWEPIQYDCVGRRGDRSRSDARSAIGGIAKRAKLSLDCGCIVCGFCNHRKRRRIQIIEQTPQRRCARDRRYCQILNWHCGTVLHRRAVTDPSSLSEIPLDEGVQLR
jgi:hypothetical protein